jgi:malate/lactate dehydrogenase
VDHNGVEVVFEPPLNTDELTALQRSAQVLKETAQAVGL